MAYKTLLTRTSTESFKLKSKGSPSGPAMLFSKTSGKTCAPIKYLNMNTKRCKKHIKDNKTYRRFISFNLEINLLMLNMDPTI